MRISCNYLSLAPLGLALLCCAPVPMIAQSASTWVPVNLRSVVPADLRVMITPASDGYRVSLQNFGTTTIHFGFYIEGLQTQDALPSNGRVHLKPRNSAGPWIIQSTGNSSGPIRVHVVEVAVGDPDTPLPADSQN